MLETLTEFLARGGWIMLPLLFCSILSLTIILERLIWGPKKAKVIPQRFLIPLRELLETERFEELLGLCRAHGDCALARIVTKALKSRHQERNIIAEVIKTAGKSEMSHLRQYLSILGTIAAVSPLLGLLGTVFGMIETFAVISSQGTGDASILASGISKALLTTAFGLSIAIPTLVFHRYLSQKIRTLGTEMEIIALEVINAVSRDSSGASQEKVSNGL